MDEHDRNLTRAIGFEAVDRETVLVEIVTLQKSGEFAAPDLRVAEAIGECRALVSTSNGTDWPRISTVLASKAG